jgi:hypothetical protein
MSPERPSKKKQPEVPDAVARVSIWYPAASYNFEPTDSYTAWRSHVVAFPPKQCYDSHLLDVTGSWATGSDGKATLLLSEFVCLPRDLSFAVPVNVVATPNSADPFFLTIQHSLIGLADVEIKVWTWDANGAAAPGVPFDWRCRVPYHPLTLTP